MNKGVITQIIGPVLDVQFPEDKVPAIYSAIKVIRSQLVGSPQKTKQTNEQTNNNELIAEVQQHLGDGQVRDVSMGATDGLKRGMEAVDTGSPISVPVGEEVLGRL